MHRRTSRVLAYLVALATFMSVMASTAIAHTGVTANSAVLQDAGYVEVVDLRVNGRYDEPLGLDDTSPIFSWRMEATRASRSHACQTAGPEVPCPADAQTAYQVQAANSLQDLTAGRHIWDSGQVESDSQTGVYYEGDPLESREPVVWRVRVWDANGVPSAWSTPSYFEMGLIDQSDWGDARWIDYPGRTEDQPLPIFARQFTAPNQIAEARLYVSGIGLHKATVNGEAVTDEVLAPGNSNYQLSSEYRTYDVTRQLRRGPNTVGVELGNGTAYVRRSVHNDEVGRTNPYSWWQSQLKGSGTLTEDAQAGATNVFPSSTNGYHVGGTINIDTGDGGDNLESRVITDIGTGPTTVAAQTVTGGMPIPTLSGANWIWNVPNAGSVTPNGTIYLRKTFDVADPAALASAVLRVNADDGHTTYVNGTEVAVSGSGNNAWQTSAIVDIKAHLVAGTNVVAAAPFNSGSPGSYIAAIELDATRIVTDGSWKALPGTPATPPAGWNTVGFDDSSWPAADVSGPYGVGPWNMNIDEPPSPTTVRVGSTNGFSVGDTITIGTGATQETKVVTAVGSSGGNGSGLTVDTPLEYVHEVGEPIRNLTQPPTGISFTPALDEAHAAGALVTGSGNNIAATDPSAGAAVTPRMIARLEVTYADGSQEVIVSDRSWRTAFGAYVTDAWYSGSDYDAQREPVGWNEAGSDLSDSAVRRDGSSVDWIDAGIAPPPNLATQLVARDGQGVAIQEEFEAVSVTNPEDGVYVFDFGQNFAGWPVLNLSTPVPAGTAIRMSPAESLSNNGSGLINQSSLGPGGRGNNLFNTYIAAGDGPETWHPEFQYFGMQWIQVTGLPDGYPVTTDLISGLRLTGDTPEAGSVSTSNDRINRIHKMAQYSFASNILSVITDCPGREKLSYPADYTMPMGAIERNHEFASFLRTTMRHLVEGQSIADTFMFGNVALKTPVYDWGYTGQFGDEINWGNAIILVPALLYELYGDTDMMTTYYDEMVDFADYIAREKAGTGDDAYIVDAALADWVAAEGTDGEITGTWGYYEMITKLAMMAELTGHDDDAAEYAALAENIKTAFNDRFYNEAEGLYAEDGGEGGDDGASQGAQALALDSDLVPEDGRDAVLETLVELIYDFNPEGDGGPHFSGGTITLASIVRSLTEAERHDVIWDVLQEDEYPGYGYFMESTEANPDGFTTIGERWTRGSSKNHMILAQIEEWFHEGIAGIREAEGSMQYQELVIKPSVVGDLTSAEGSYRSPQGLISSEWRTNGSRLHMTVEIPANTTAEVWVPGGDASSATSQRADFIRTEDGYAVYEVGSGRYNFAGSVG